MLRTTRARWVVRLSMAVLFLGIVGYFTFAVLNRTTRIPASEARVLWARYIRLGTPLAEIERLYGPAEVEEARNGRWLTWVFQEESLSHYQSFLFTVKIHDGKVIELLHGQSILQDWDLWKSRWNAFYWRFRN